jgi:hypothetical protein
MINDYDIGVLKAMEDSIRNIDYASVVGLVIDIAEGLAPLTYVSFCKSRH